MFIDCKALDTGRKIRDFATLARLLKEGDLVSPKGSLKEELKVFMGGAFFKTPKAEEEVFPGSSAPLTWTGTTRGSILPDGT